MKVVALTVSTAEKVHTWRMEDYPNTILGHSYCVALLSDIDPATVTGSGWVYEDGTEVLLPHRWNPAYALKLRLQAKREE